MSKPQLTAAIIVVSTTVSLGTSEDKTTTVLEDVFSHQDQCSWGIVAEQVVTDDFKEIQDIVATIVELHEPSLVVLSGGTGFAVSDVTPEAVSELLEKQAPGLVHGMLSSSAAITPCKLSSSTLIMWLIGMQLLSCHVL